MHVHPASVLSSGVVITNRLLEGCGKQRKLFVCFNPEDNHCVESQFRLFSCSVFCFSLAEFSLREDWRTVLAEACLNS